MLKHVLTTDMLQSTQVPQFLYEGGMCLNKDDPESQYLIGVTQPRRVAAVSTAKRVCFEVGKGDGQTIKSKGKRGNLVSYKTRYESAGSGSETAIQFMTDGILLQEIQEDLLLRKYSVIVLDEAHERNLNTDVLIGLLSKTIPLRRQAAEESPDIVPLRLVLMSATLRVEDFTKNESLFPGYDPFVVKVPGRTFPVSIHHSKITELDDYGKIYFVDLFFFSDVVLTLYCRTCCIQENLQDPSQASARRYSRVPDRKARDSSHGESAQKGIRIFSWHSGENQ